MKTTIYFFTGTGNSYAAAKSLAEKLGDTEIISIAETGEEAVICETPNAGFIFPCYFGEMPKVMIDFIKKADLSRVDYTFCLPTAGGAHGIIFKMMKDLLKEKGKSLNLGHTLTIQTNYIVAPYYMPLYKKQEELGKTLVSLDKTLDRVASEIKNRKKRVQWNNVPHHVLVQFYYRKMLAQGLHLQDRDFSTSKDCVGCKRCSKVCPAGNITYSSKQPVWNSKCHQCLACVQLCPKEAIMFRGEKLDKPRFKHPDVTVAELVKCAGNG